MSHSLRRRRERVDSRLLVVGSQTTSLTPSPSFAHNLGCRCPNGQCEAIFDIYVSRPFQWHQEHLNARCFGPCCRALNIRESRRAPNLQLFQVLGFTPTLGQSGVATLNVLYNFCNTTFQLDSGNSSNIKINYLNKSLELYYNCKIVVQGMLIHLPYIMYIWLWSMYIDFPLKLHTSC